MSKYLVDSTEMTAIADAIRLKDGTQTTMTVTEMPTRIQNIPSGGGTDYMAQRVQGTLSSYIIPNTCTRIHMYAFAYQPITSITIPNSVTNIQEGAFVGAQLSSITIPNSVTSIGANAFSNTNLTSITIPNSVDTLGSYSFHSTQLTSVTIPNSVETMGNYVFSNISTLTSVTFDNNMDLTLGSNTFDGCSHLTTLNNFDIEDIHATSSGRRIIPYYCFRDTALEGDISLGSGFVYVNLQAFNNSNSSGMLYIHLTQDDISLIPSSYSFSTGSSETLRSFNFDHCRLVVPYSENHEILATYQGAWPNYRTIMIEEAQ